MKKKPTVPDIQTQRRDNYVTHFESRQQVKAMEDWMIQRLKNVAEVVRAPKLNEFGCDDCTEEEWNHIIALANSSGVPANLCIRWYHSDQDWDNFQVHWQNLPESGRDKFAVIVEKKKFSTSNVHNS